ncbi:MAG: DUF4198 domain-containing protein [Thermoanaerobaculia bacterium]
MKGRAALLSAALGSLAAAAALAHDFWIEPSSFRPAVGSALTISLRVGEDFRGEPVPRDPALIRKFVLVSGGSETPIEGLAGADPAGLVRVPGPGAIWIAYRGGRKPITLEAETFEAYLAEEGLERVSEIRRERGQSGKPAREVYSRSVKALLFAGEGDAADLDRALGMTLELVPRQDPRKISAGGLLPIRLVYEGKPLKGALVVAQRRAAPEEEVRARTDARGEAAMRLSGKGIWLLKAVHMVPAPPGVDADWESVWTSLTFEIP